MSFRIRGHEALPSPLMARQSAIIQHAEVAREIVGLRTGFDLPKLIAANNGRIVMQDALDPDPTRAFEMTPDGRFTIYLSSLRGALSNVMITACELGHFALHKEKFMREHPGKSMVVPKQIDAAGGDLIRCKRETVWFATGLLMPEPEFMRIFEERGLEDASAYFGVLPEAAFKRHEQIMLMREAAESPSLS